MRLYDAIDDGWILDVGPALVVNNDVVILGPIQFGIQRQHGRGRRVVGPVNVDTNVLAFVCLYTAIPADQRSHGSSHRQSTMPAAAWTRLAMVPLGLPGAGPARCRDRLRRRRENESKRHHSRLFIDFMAINLKRLACDLNSKKVGMRRAGMRDADLAGVWRWPRVR